MKEPEHETGGMGRENPSPSNKPWRGRTHARLRGRRPQRCVCRSSTQPVSPPSPFHPEMSLLHPELSVANCRVLLYDTQYDEKQHNNAAEWAATLSPLLRISTWNLIIFSKLSHSSQHTHFLAGHLPWPRRSESPRSLYPRPFLRTRYRKT